LAKAREGIRESPEYQRGDRRSQRELEAVYRTETGETPKAQPSDPVLDKLNAELRTMKPNTELLTKIPRKAF